MSKIHLIKKPGYIRDLFFIFFLKFNTDYCMEYFVNKDRADEDKKFYKEVLNDFSPISEDLYIFFHIHVNGRCFFSCSYFDPYINRLTTDYDFDFVLNELTDHRSLIKKLIEFYFYELSDEEVERCLKFDSEIYKVIKNSEYSDSEKLHLYEFFLNPNFYIQKLHGELTVMEMKLSLYYEKNYSRIFDSFNKLNVDIIAKQLEPIKDVNCIKREEYVVYLSFCLLNREFVYVTSIDTNVVFLFGDQYTLGIEQCKKEMNNWQLDRFGMAIGEKNRVAILDYMLEYGEVNCKDIEQHFSFSGSTAYHHLTTLMKYGVIKSRNDGKNVYYSINSKCIDAVIKKLHKYSSREKKGLK